MVRGDSDIAQILRTVAVVLKAHQMPCDMQGIERLSLVAKVLMDTRLLELKRENEELKLALFWKEHNPCMLKQAMRQANAVGPSCACLACIVGGRCDSGTLGYAPYQFVQQYDEHTVMTPCDRCHIRCQFKPFFEQKIEEHDMSVGFGVPGMHLPLWVDGGVVHDGSAALDDGHHFSNLQRKDWNTFAYGSRLWKAASVTDPDLMKLKRLFHALALTLPRPHTPTPSGSSSR